MPSGRAFSALQQLRVSAESMYRGGHMPWCSRLEVLRVKMEILLEGSLDLQLDTNINSFVKMFLAWFTMSWPAAV